MVQTIIESKKPKIKGKANVAFILDVTGSMGDCLENLKSSLLELSGQIATISAEQYGAAEPDISYNALGYRDLTTEEPEEYMIVKRDSAFTKNLDELKKFFSEEKMTAAGGGDEPESALDALVIAAREMVWDQPVRMMVLFTDASTKISLHKTTTGGSQLDEAESMSVLIEELTSRKIRVIIFGPPNVDEFMKIGTLNNCQYKPMEKGAETLKNFKDELLFKEEIVKLIAKSVSQSASTAVPLSS
ncbi:MAG: VWA domain-containing protein [Methanosarcinaceae archaeon]|nr:VWA domain-containing protein [Methanosarcinaceae archaeon]